MYGFWVVTMVKHVERMSEKDRHRELGEEHERWTKDGPYKPMIKTWEFLQFTNIRLSTLLLEKFYQKGKHLISKCKLSM